MSGSIPHERGFAFRPDIEGLRALAILLVVASHAGVPGMAGGFVGVDVFFVLSGYLITGLLLQEYRATGRMRLADFYARRARRLLPALLLVVAASCAAAALLLSPRQQDEHAATALSAVLWLSNFYFAFFRLEYFGPEVASNLFLHTWSLGVEEQFYLVWPLALLFLLGGWRWQRGRGGEARLAGGMLVAVALCLPLSIMLSYTQPSWGFYLMPSRAWQFALGALAAIRWPSAVGRPAGAPSVPFELLGWAGFVAIILCAPLVGPDDSYPGWRALVPSLGAAAVLVAGARQPGGSLQRLLGTPVPQAIGRWSYGWYLWHWPVLVLGQAVLPAEPGVRLGLVALSLALAVASFGVLERPVRRNAWLAARPAITLLGGLACVVVAAAATVAWRESASRWAGSEAQKPFVEVRKDVPAIYPMGCDDWFHSSDVKVCGFGERDATHTAVLMGDSILAQWFPAILPRYTRPGWRLAVITKSSCPMVDESYVNGRISRRFVECDTWRPAALETAAGFEPDVVIIGSALAYPFDARQWEQGSRRVMERLAPSAGAIAVIAATHPLGFDGPDCLAGRAWRAPLSTPRDGCESVGGSPREAEVLGALARAAAAFPNAEVFDLNELVCRAGRCSAEQDGRIVYRDGTHLSAAFVESLAPAVGRRLDEAGIP